LSPGRRTNRCTQCLLNHASTLPVFRRGYEFPRPLAFQPCRRRFFEFPRISHPSAVLCSKSPGFPGFPLLRSRRLTPSRVSPNPASSGYASGSSLRPSILPVSRRPQKSNPRSLCCTGDRSPSFLGSRILRRSRRPKLRVSPAPFVLRHCQRRESRFPQTLSSSSASDASPGFPELGIFRLCRLRVFERPRILLPRLGR